jgi:hypothetical protein
LTCTSLSLTTTRHCPRLRLARCADHQLWLWEYTCDLAASSWHIVLGGTRTMDVRRFHQGLSPVASAAVSCSCNGKRTREKELQWVCSACGGIPDRSANPIHQWQWQ